MEGNVVEKGKKKNEEGRIDIDTTPDRPCRRSLSFAYEYVHPNISIFIFKSFSIAFEIDSLTNSMKNNMKMGKKRALVRSGDESFENVDIFALRFPERERERERYVYRSSMDSIGLVSGKD